MLEEAKLVAFLATVDAARARTFYQETLGLNLVEDSPFALVFEAGETMLRIQKVEKLSPHPFTALGWETPDLAAMIESLRKRGVTCELFAGLDQNADAIWQSPSGAKIAWFRDPDGNLLSLTEFS